MVIIDKIYESVIAQLTKQEKILTLSLKLHSLKTNSERVLFVYDILKSLDSLVGITKVEKSVDVSTYYRNLGNKSYQSLSNYAAWQYYNLSLLHAPIGSELYTLALANRSAVFYSLKKYTACLKDISKIFSGEYPEKLKNKLEKRKQSCEVNVVHEKEAQNENEMELEFLELGPTNKRYPCASEKLEVVYTEDMGRHVIAKEDISVGEVLVQECPYFTVLLKSQILFSCSYCISRKLNLLPCPECCFALYCSEECKDKAYNEYHKFECPLMATLIDMNFTRLELLALRAVIKARTDHTDWDSLFKTIEAAESMINTEYHGHVKVDGEWVYDSKYYASTHTLETNIEKRSVSDVFQKAVTAAIFLNFLSSYTNFLKVEDEKKSEEIWKCVAGMFLLHIMTSPTNMHGLSSNLQMADGNFVEELSLASGSYAYHSLLNHSCAPNVVRYSALGSSQMTLFALGHIKKGMQLFDNYGSHHAIESRVERLMNLKFQYKFQCRCKACIDDWPMYLFLKPARGLPFQINKKKMELLNSYTLEKLKQGCVDVAIELYKPLCELTEQLDTYAPCMELADCQEALKQCLALFRGVVPYGFGKIVDWKAIPNTS